MAEFINTVDVMGEDALMDAIISRTLTELKDDTVTEIGYYALSACYSLRVVDLPKLTRFSEQRAFSNCARLEALILRNTGAVCVGNYNTLFSAGTSTPAGVTYIYVPAALVDSYKSANHWSEYANQFRALEDYTVDGTTTGELDPTKI